MFNRSLAMLVLSGCGAVAVAVALTFSGAAEATVQVAEPRINPILPPNDAPVPTPSGDSAGRLRFEDLIYQGAFRVREEGEGESFSYGGQTLAYNQAANTLFMGSLHSMVAEVSIPTPVKSAVVSELPVASMVQPFRDPTDGHLRDIAENGVILSGLHVQDGRLYGTGLIYYDASNAQRVSHFERPLDLTRAAVTRIYQVGENSKSGFVAGYMASVPSEYRAALGGSAVTGQCCVSIISRTSYGPALFAWNPGDLGRKDPAPATPLVYYPQQHTTLGAWESANEMFGGTTQVVGVAIIDGSRTVLFAGRNGSSYCYGEGTSDAAKSKTHGPNGETYCYDPTDASKGPHGYPYRLQFWAYDVDDLASVRSGKKDPWEVRPYAVWPFELPEIGDPYPRLGAVAYDSAHRRLFLTQLYGEKDGYGRRPIVHVFNIRGQ